MKALTNIPASIRQRLFNKARAEGGPGTFQSVLTRYAIERLLARLAQHQHRDKFFLKGAMLFLTWPVNAPRPTLDLDLLAKGSADEAHMANLFKEICAIEDGQDGLTFLADTIATETLREEDEYEGVRVKLEAKLDKARINVQVDVGFGDYVHPAPREIDFPTLLPGLTEPRVFAYPKESVVAEKFEAMLRYGAATSRLKDHYDIRTISRTFDFDKAVLAEAIAGTLKRRGTALPTATAYALTDEFARDPAKMKMWEAFLERSAPTDRGLKLDAVASELRAFLGPALVHVNLPEAAQGEWLQAQRAWTQ
jgi:hypothetical protein